MLACSNQSVDPLPQPKSAKVVKSDNEPSTLLVESQGSSVLLDGQKIQVRWDDGDTFKGKHPETGKKISARLAGYNTLESYGPVHQWGEWSSEELYLLAKEAGRFASAKEWSCSDTGKEEAMAVCWLIAPIFAGRFWIPGWPIHFQSVLLPVKQILPHSKLPLENKSGIWAKGVPKLLLTSLHSQDEKPDQDAYNRSCVVNTGQCDKVTHTNTYTECQLVCTQSFQRAVCSMFRISVVMVLHEQNA